jgi:hypothetical protein
MISPENGHDGALGLHGCLCDMETRLARQCRSLQINL